MSITSQSIFDKDMPLAALVTVGESARAEHLVKTLSDGTFGILFRSSASLWQALCAWHAQDLVDKRPFQCDQLHCSIPCLMLVKAPGSTSI